MPDIPTSFERAKVEELSDKVSDLSRRAADKIDQNRDAAAGGLDKAATALHGNAQSLPGGEKVTHLAQATAEQLHSSADYVRGHDVDSMMADVRKIVVNNPAPSVLVAAFIGFFVGRSFRSKE